MGATRSTSYYYNFLPYDQFGSGIAKKNIQAYVIDPKRRFESFDFTAPTEISNLAVNGGYGSDFFLSWTDSIADDGDDERNQDIDHYEVWQSTQYPIGTAQEDVLKSGASQFPNQNFIKHTATPTELLLNNDPGTAYY